MKKTKKTYIAGCHAGCSRQTPRTDAVRRRLVHLMATDLCRIRREQIVRDGVWEEVFDAVSDACRGTVKTAVREKKGNALAMLIRRVALIARSYGKEVRA